MQEGLMMIRRSRLLLAFAAVALVARPALAGPPLLCFPFDIGSTRSLPIGTGGWHAIDPRYDASHVVDDTLALLTPEMPIVARMETLRRATLYAYKDAANGAALLDRLQQRASMSSANAPLAVFDFGYLVETDKQAAYAFGQPMKGVENIDGYSLVVKAAALRGDPAIEFALAVMTRGNTHVADAHRTHLARAIAAARSDASVQANLPKQFGDELAAQR
jgi:hypothetical protein